MKNSKKKKQVMIIGLICCLVFISVGYAILSQTLTTNVTGKLTGSWKIYISSITPVTNSTKAVSTNAEVVDELNASFGVKFNIPGDYMEYDVVVKNDGNIDAVLDEVNTSISGRSDLVTVTRTIRKGSKLLAGNEVKFRIKIQYNASATELPGNETINYDIKLIYVQFDEQINADQPKYCYTVNNDGVITDYDMACGTDVVIPDSYDEITITSIGSGAFAESNFEIYFDDNDTSTFIAKNAGAKANALKNSDILEMINSGELTADHIYDKSTLTEEEYNNLIKGKTFGGALMFDSDGNMNEGAVGFVTSVDFSHAKHLTTIEDNAFGGESLIDSDTSKCKSTNSLKSVTFGNDSKIKKIGNHMFTCAELDSLSIPNTVTSFGSDSYDGGAFNNTKVTNLTVYLNKFANTYPFKGLTVINANVLAGNNKVLGSIGLNATNVILGEGITGVSYLPTGLKSMTLPSTITDSSDLNSVFKNVTTNISVIMNHTIAPSFYNDTNWYNSQYVTVTWPNIN